MKPEVMSDAIDKLITKLNEDITLVENINAQADIPKQNIEKVYDYARNRRKQADSERREAKARLDQLKFSKSNGDKDVTNKDIEDAKTNLIIKRAQFADARSDASDTKSALSAVTRNESISPEEISELCSEFEKVINEGTDNMNNENEKHDEIINESNDINEGLVNMIKNIRIKHNEKKLEKAMKKRGNLNVKKQKLNKLQDRLQKLREKFNAAEGNPKKQERIQKMIDDVQNKINAANEKIESKLEPVENKLNKADQKLVNLGESLDSDNYDDIDSLLEEIESDLNNIENYKEPIIPENLEDLFNDSIGEYIKNALETGNKDKNVKGYIDTIEAEIHKEDPDKMKINTLKLKLNNIIK